MGWRAQRPVRMGNPVVLCRGDAHIAPINNIDTKHENAHVDKYVIMPNHIHMIIALKNGAMWA